MPLSSVELARRCHERGILSKEAMDDVLRVRSKLIKEALAEKAASWAGGLGKTIKDGAIGWRDAAGHIGKMVALGGALAVGGAGVSGLMRHSRDKSAMRDIESSYKQMFHETPGLDQMDKAKIVRHFGVLARYAPSIAADPTVAGAWVKSTIQMGHVDADLVGKLSTTQSIIDRHNEGRTLFQPGAFTAGINVAKAALGKPQTSDNG